MRKNSWTLSAALFVCLTVTTEIAFAQTSAPVDLGTLNAKASKLAEPQFPENAGNLGLSSNYINVRVIVNEFGGVVKAEAISGAEQLQPAAVLAAVRTTFAPYLSNGKAIKFTGILTFLYRSAFTKTVQNATLPNFNNLIKMDFEEMAKEINAKKVTEGLSDNKYAQAVTEIDKLLLSFDEKNEQMKKAIANQQSETAMDNLTNCQTESEMTDILGKLRAAFEQMQKDKLKSYDKGRSEYDARQKEMPKILSSYRCVLV